MRSKLFLNFKTSYTCEQKAVNCSWCICNVNICFILTAPSLKVMWKVLLSSSISCLLSSHDSLITLVMVPLGSAITKKPKGGACLSACNRNCVTGAKLYRGISPVNKGCVGGDYTELWPLRLIALHAVCLADRIAYKPDHWTQHFLSPLDASLSDSEKCCYFNIKCHQDSTTVLSYSERILICYANNCCLMHNQFSVIQMVCWQQIECYKIALRELKYHCMNGFHMNGGNAEWDNRVFFFMMN